MRRAWSVEVGRVGLSYSGTYLIACSLRACGERVRGRSLSTKALTRWQRNWNTRQGLVNRGGTNRVLGPCTFRCRHGDADTWDRLRLVHQQLIVFDKSRGYISIKRSPRIGETCTYFHRRHGRESAQLKLQLNGHTRSWYSLETFKRLSETLSEPVPRLFPE
jgi:hypothetical protein